MKNPSNASCPVRPRPALRVEHLEARRLLAGVTGGGTEVLSNRFVGANGNTFDQVLMTGSSVTVTADPGQVTRVSYLDLQGDIVQAEFSGAGSLTIILDQSGGPAPAANYLQPEVDYVSGLASLVVRGSDASTNFRIFAVSKATAVNQALFDDAHTGGNQRAEVSRLTILADPLNFGGSNFGGVFAGNAVFAAAEGFVGILADNVHVQSIVRIGGLQASGSAIPVLHFGANSQFVDVEVPGVLADFVSPNGRLIDDLGGLAFSVTFVGSPSGPVFLDPLTGAVPPDPADELFLSSNSASPGFHVLRGTAGDDVFTGDVRKDFFTGGDGDDLLMGFGGADILLGDAGRDTLQGGEGDDILWGGSGADGINGGAGDDLVWDGGDGADVLTGGLGADTWVILPSSSAESVATIVDTAKGDRIFLLGSGGVTFNAARLVLGGAAGFQDYLNAAAAGAATEAVTWFQFNGDTYLVQDRGAAATFAFGTDVVVRLTGLNDLSSMESDGAGLLTVV